MVQALVNITLDTYATSIAEASLIVITYVDIFVCNQCVL